MLYLFSHNANRVHLFFSFFFSTWYARMLLYPHIQSLRCITARLGTSMGKRPALHTGAWHSFRANRAALDCGQFCEIFFLMFFYGWLCLPSEDMLNETLVESVQYHGDGNESSEVNWSYAFPCFCPEMCSELGLPPVAPLFHLRLSNFHAESGYNKNHFIMKIFKHLSISLHPGFRFNSISCTLSLPGRKKTAFAMTGHTLQSFARGVTCTDKLGKYIF